MTLKIRIIPSLLLSGPGLVKGKSFSSDRRVGPVMPALRVYNRREVDELLVVNVLGFQEGFATRIQSLREIGTEAFVPLTYGGGIRSLDDASLALRNGADKIAVNSAAYRDPGLISKVASTHGSQAVVSSIDVVGTGPESWTCVSSSGRYVENKDPVSWAREVTDRGAGEILLTSVDRDGTMQGFDLNVIEAVSTAVDIPVIASGGAGAVEHFLAALNAGASALCAASIFHFTEITPSEVKRFLGANGVPVRLPHSEE